MASTVKVPLLGTHSKGTVVGVTLGGVTVAGFMIYRYNKNKQAATAATQAAASAAATSANAYGYGSAGAYGYGNGYYGYGNNYGYGASGGFAPTGYYGYGTPQPTSTPVTTNAQWTQAAISQLQGDQYDPHSVAAALGMYLAGREVSPEQVHIIDAAIGVEGYPPQSAASGFPPGIKTGGTTGGGQNGGPSSIDAPGNETLPQIASGHQISTKRIDTLNPALFARYGNKNEPPKGTKVRIR